MTHDEQLARIAVLEAELAAAQRKTVSGGLKVSEKGALSVYGLGRFPVTLYPEQFIRLLDKDTEIRAFIKANWEKFSHKPEVTTPAS